MSLVNFTNLDFDQIKQTLKDYLQNNSKFTDYDFEGSNLSSILDVLAYNTYITSYNANMVANEVFIDSATLRENVVALARNIGYVPRSKKSSRTKLRFRVDVSSISPTPSSLTLKAGPVATSSGQFRGRSFVFSIPEDISIPVIDGVALFDEIEVYEGTLLENVFTFASRSPNQKFILPNTGIDLDTLVVNVSPSLDSTVSVKYERHDNLFDNDSNRVVNSGSNIFFLQEVSGEQYELIFGDGVFGKELQDGNVVRAKFIITSGADANGIKSFSYAGRLTYTRNGVELNVTSGIGLLFTPAQSSGGEDIESIDSVRKYAPQIYATQNRALSANDYEILIPNKIYPETESISVFGGEELVPPQFGKVFISIKPRNGDFVPNLIKQNIKRDLKKYSVAGIVPEILDLKYLFIETNSKVYYNTNLAPSSSFVGSSVQRNINSYAGSSQLNRYGARFKYSKFLKIIDQSHESITSNITTIEMRRDLRLAISEVAEYAIDFGNQFHIKSMNGFNIRTSAFRVLNINTDVYLYDVPNADAKKGQIGLFSLDAGTASPIIQRRNIGVINYETGRITLDPINIVSGKTKDNVQIMEISVSPESNDVIGLQDLYLQLDSSTVDTIVDEISSGIDPSGSNYTISTSYSNRNIVR
tara:strand:- start:1356 stop:3287 length:1932 start_codon:yes stop_codon:yes gene_type:complete